MGFSVRDIGYIGGWIKKAFQWIWPRKRVRELEKELELRRQRDWDEKLCVYWVKDRDGEKWPYCPVCWDKDNKSIRLQKGQRNSWHCLVCENLYGWDPGPAETYEEPPFDRDIL